jgi:multidrug efflux system membrane fusion protein
MLQANVAKDVAAAKYADAEQKRYATLVKQGAVSSEQSDQMSTNAATAQAVIDADNKAVENARDVVNADKAAIDTAIGTLQADQAAASNAKIQLGWTEIRSPLDGRTGSLNVYEGNVVQANQTTALVTIDQITPIYIQFTLPELSLDQIRSGIQNGTLKVEALIEGQKTDSVEGSVSFLQNTVDTTSGTVTLRATFANAKTRLFPGQFVDVVVTMPSDGNTVVVPATALQTSQQGNSVYVVQPDNTVNFVTVELKRTYGNMAAIGKGLKAGDVVVTDGQLQLTPGAKVAIQKTMGRPPDTNAGAPPSEDAANGN